MYAYRNIMVHVPIGSDDGARVALAADLADRFNARLTGIAAGCLRMPMTTSVGGVALARILAMEEQQLGEAFCEAGARFRQQAGSAAQDLRWQAFPEFPAQALSREARAADLLVVGRGEDAAGTTFNCTLNPGELVMQAGRPVLIVPPGLRYLAGTTVLVGWTDAREARRAVLDALPLLRQAEQVQVLEVCGANDVVAEAARRAGSIAEHLRRHGVKAEGQARRLSEATVADQLMAMAEFSHADLLVTGAYGHSRLQEWIFGGVTHALIRRASCCCLLSH